MTPSSTLTPEQIAEAPEEVTRIWSGTYSKFNSKRDEVIEMYPEYFPEITEYRRKWALVPQEVHDAYNKEFQEQSAKLDDRYPTKSMAEGASLEEVLDQISIKMGELREIMKPIYERHYSEYGLKFVWNV